jgi:hypothetical protein
MIGRGCVFAGQSSRVQQCENTTEYYSSKTEWEVFYALSNMLEMGCYCDHIMESLLLM